MTRHNYMQKRDRLMREIRDAHTVLLWTLNSTDRHEKRSRFIATRRLIELSRDLHRHLQSQP